MLQEYEAYLAREPGNLTAEQLEEAMQKVMDEYVAGVATDIADGLARARAAIDSGAARQAQSDFVRTTRELAAA